jgi:hypothetical protein
VLAENIIYKNKKLDLANFERIINVGVSKITWELRDNGGRRSGIDRRYFSYYGHIPERRGQEERRSHEDRRSGSERRRPDADLFNIVSEQRASADRRSAWA